eukprot:14715154-Ditylum_brightwellii.AAC.1
MKFDWCKIFSAHSDKFGAWISEIWCSFARIMKWLYSLIDDVAPDLNFVQPSKPIEQWNARECANYLKYFAFHVEKYAQQDTSEKATTIFHDGTIEKIPHTSEFVQQIQFKKW